MPNKPLAIIADLDGTLSLLNGRNPYKYHLSKFDLPNILLINILQSYKDQGYKIFIISGRGKSSKIITEEWLKDHNIPCDSLYMKPDGDRRKSNFYKEETLVSEILPYYDVKIAYDDYEKNLEIFRRYNIETVKVSEKTGEFV